MINKIISGGQTGADRAALDFAIKNNIPHGGWVPRGRKTEDGRLPEQYQLREMPTAEYSKRTKKNIIISDGTVIVSHGPLTGGSALTRELAKQHRRPWIHLDMKELPLKIAANRLSSWIETNQVKIMNIAGSRGSKDPQIYQATMELLDAAFSPEKNVSGVRK
jgi:hypothetical protein